MDVEPPKKAEVDGSAWLLTYGDMVTLLMAFFVMLFAVSSVEADKFEAFLSGLSDFDNPAASEVFSPVGDPIPPAVQPPVQAVIPGATAEGAGTGTGTTGTGTTGTDQLAGEMVQSLAMAGVEETVEVVHDKRGLVLIVGTDDVLFESGSATITDYGRSIVGALGPHLAGITNDLIVEGHTDDVPLDRNGYSNWNLSTDRAVSVVNALAGDHGIDPRRLEATGFGEFDPRDTSAPSREVRARNRRVEIVVLANPAQGPAAAEQSADDLVGAGSIAPGIDDPVGISTIVPPIVRQ